MANTGVLPFVRGINFAKNDFKVSVIYLKLLPYCSSVTIFFNIYSEVL